MHPDMPPMTMMFQVKNAPLLDRIMPGDKIRFHAEKVGSGFVVTDIKAVH